MSPKTLYTDDNDNDDKKDNAVWLHKTDPSYVSLSATCVRLEKAYRSLSLVIENKCVQVCQSL